MDDVKAGKEQGRERERAQGQERAQGLGLGLEPKLDPAPRFTKGQLLASERYRGRRDALAAVLEDGRPYSLAEADDALKGFMERTVA